MPRPLFQSRWRNAELTPSGNSPATRSWFEFGAQSIRSWFLRQQSELVVAEVPTRNAREWEASPDPRDQTEINGQLFEVSTVGPMHVSGVRGISAFLRADHEYPTA